ncbi:MAG: hypothetical protein ACXW0F_13585 [Gaiellaceae bacterium]
MTNHDPRQGGIQDSPMSRDADGATMAQYAPSAPQQMPQYGYQQPNGHQLQAPRRSRPIETKPFFLTSEFVAAVLVIAGIAITAASSDAFGAWRAWILITAVTGAYMISRGIAKSGTRSHADDPREQLDLNWGQGK